MDNYQPALNDVFSALADPTRRAIVGRLSLGPATVSELSEPFDIQLPSLMKHLRVLEKGGLISSEKLGRVRTCRLVTAPLKQSNDWLSQHIDTWEQRLDRLETHIHHHQKGTSSDDEHQ